MRDFLHWVSELVDLFHLNFHLYTQGSQLHVTTLPQKLNEPCPAYPRVFLHQLCCLR